MGRKGNGAKPCKKQYLFDRAKKCFIILVFFANNKTERGPPAKRDLKKERERERNNERKTTEKEREGKGKGKGKGKEKVK